MIVCRVRVTEPPVHPAIGVASPRGSSGKLSSLTIRMISVLLVDLGWWLSLPIDLDRLRRELRVALEDGPRALLHVPARVRRGTDGGSPEALRLRGSRP